MRPPADRSPALLLAATTVLDGKAEPLCRRLAGAVGDLHGEFEGTGCGGRASQLAVVVVRRVRRLQRQSGRQLAGGHCPNVGPPTAAEEILRVGHADSAWAQGR